MRVLAKSVLKNGYNKYKRHWPGAEQEMVEVDVSKEQFDVMNANKKLIVVPMAAVDQKAMKAPSAPSKDER
jgi:hypothetical protein